MKTWTHCLAGLALLLTIAGARAQAVRLDDSLSHTVPPSARMQWRPLTSGATQADAMETWVRVNLRIDTRAWAGRQGRIYMVMPREEASTLEAVWTTTGRLQPGQLRSGERALVFAGDIPGPMLEEQMLVRLRSGADWQNDSRRVNVHFELEQP